MSDFAKDTNVPINDCISRQAAIDALYKMLHDCFWAEAESTTETMAEMVLRRTGIELRQMTDEILDGGWE